jgi:enoyl-CoA hydratase/carnithine racemase
VSAPARSPSEPLPAPTPLLLREDDNGVAILTLNRAHARNSLSQAFICALTDEFQAIAADRSVCVVVLAANGPVFCAGHDLKEITARRGEPDRGRAFFERVMERCCALMLAIVRLPQPVIAAVQGTATAAGCQLVASCDLAVASSAATFATPGVDIGLFCSTPMVALSRNVARKHALEMLLTGEPVPAAEALRIGLINRVVAPGSERTEALALAHLIASKPRAVVKTGKEAFYRQIEMDLAAAYAYAAEVMVANLLAREAQEGIAAFVEKRPPTWQDS